MPIYALGEQVPSIHPTAYVHPDAIVIGSVTIGADSVVTAGSVVTHDVPPRVVVAGHPARVVKPL